MVATMTDKQAERVKEVFERGPVYALDHRLVPFEEFCEGVHPTFGCDGAVTVYWAGMWLCIEKDGYCHS